MSISRGEEAYTLRVQGLTWIEVASRIDASPKFAGNAATMVAKKYATSRGLAWPLSVSKPIQPVPPRDEPIFLAKQKNAYDLRVEGFPWADVAELTGYRHVNHAVTAASKHAERNNLPWPIQKSV